MADIRQQRPCRLYSAGHCVHWIQARKGWEDLERPPIEGRLVTASRRGLVTIEVEHRELRLWNHDPLRLLEAAALSDGRIRYQAQWSLLLAGGGYAFCVAASPQNHVRCQAPFPD